MSEPMLHIAWSNGEAVVLLSDRNLRFEGEVYPYLYHATLDLSGVPVSDLSQTRVDNIQG